MYTHCVFHHFTFHVNLDYEVNQMWFYGLCHINSELRPRPAFCQSKHVHVACRSLESREMIFRVRTRTSNPRQKYLQDARLMQTFGLKAWLTLLWALGDSEDLPSSAH